MAVVELYSVSKKYGPTVALSNVSLLVGTGETCLVVGPNGSGKTTLLKIINGMARPTSGSVRVFGVDPWRSYPRIGSRVAFSYEGLPLPWWMSGKEFIGWVAATRGGYRAEIAEMLGVTEYWRRPVSSYSSGMRKKIILLLALGFDADLYILDEPFTLIDSATLEKVISLLDSLRSGGATVIISTHIFPGSVKERAEQVVYMYNGSIARVEVKGS